MHSTPDRPWSVPVHCYKVRCACWGRSKRCGGGVQLQRQHPQAGVSVFDKGRIQNIEFLYISTRCLASQVAPAVGSSSSETAAAALSAAARWVESPDSQLTVLCIHCTSLLIMQASWLPRPATSSSSHLCCSVLHCLSANLQAPQCL